MTELPANGGPGQDDLGVRRNALSAPSWTAIAEVDRRVSDALLDSLEDADVAAYAEPVAAGPGWAGVAPVDRIHVDLARRNVAEAVVAAELPGLLAELAGPVDDEAAFDAIVADFDREPDLPVPPWPVVEDVGAPRPPPEPVRIRLQQDFDEAEPRSYDEGHFVPPPPEPIPEAHFVTRWAAVAVAIGLLLLVGLPLLGTYPSTSVQVLGMVGVIGGIAVLVLRMRDTPPVDGYEYDDDDPDDGAVI